MKIIERWKNMRKRNKILIVATGFVLLGGIAGFVSFRYIVPKKSQNGMPFMAQMENGRITGSGTTATNMVSKQLEIDSLETKLYVEEVYVSSGDSISKGDKVLKLTDESIEEARKELKQKATEAEVAYNEQKISCEENLIEAKKNADITLVEGEYADSGLSVELEAENQTLANLEKETAQAKELLEEYEAAVNSNYYYTYYDVEKLQKESDEAFAYLMQLYSDWNIEEAEQAQKNGINGAQMGAFEEELEYDPEEYSLYQKFDTVVSTMRDEWKVAKENYETDTKKAAYSLEATRAEYELLNAQLQEQTVVSQQTKVLLQAECDMAKAEAELAEVSYEAEKKQLTEELNRVADENDIAQENMQIFEEVIGDGYLYADEAGEIMMVNAREGNALELTMPYLVYSDSSNVSVTVSVDQSYIAELTVGDKASVIINELGTYEGRITSINPVSESGSRSSVYYSVFVTLSGDVSEVTSNLTATVMFGKEIEKFEGEQRKGDEHIEKEKTEEGRPEFTGNPDDSEKGENRKNGPAEGTENEAGEMPQLPEGMERTSEKPEVSE